MMKANALFFATAALIGLSGAVAEAAPAKTGATNIVLVHGALVDGSSWRGVYEILRKDGYRVSIVQEPLTSLDDDVAATKRVLDLQDGPVVLVGHSYGGTIITVAGADPKVKALVYVAALQPDAGESTGELASRMPPASPNNDIKSTTDGYLYLDRSKFADYFPDLPKAQAAFMAASQVPVAGAAFGAKVTVAAWHDKPSYAILATHDRQLSPDLAHWMYKRSGAAVTEIKASHLVYVSQPRAVAKMIEQAARAAK
ncbi:MAG TPA: alpha/beta hydrolase [Stellaceae bacterium]|nr:alpha/beta hydrolase [Stellaceae bacterium]